jgi:uncharacterized membrane protein
MEYVINANQVFSNPVINVLITKLKITVVIFRILMPNALFVNQDIMEYKENACLIKNLWIILLDHLHLIVLLLKVLKVKPVKLMIVKSLILQEKVV